MSIRLLIVIHSIDYACLKYFSQCFVIFCVIQHAQVSMTAGIPEPSHDTGVTQPSRWSPVSDLLYWYFKDRTSWFLPYTARIHKCASFKARRLLFALPSSYPVYTAVKAHWRNMCMNCGCTQLMVKFNNNFNMKEINTLRSQRKGRIM